MRLPGARETRVGRRVQYRSITGNVVACASRTTRGSPSMSKSTVVQASSSVPATAVTPYRRSLPLLGDTLGFLAGADRYLMETHRRHGNVVNVSLFGRRWTMLFRASTNEFVYQNRGEQFARRRSGSSCSGRSLARPPDAGFRRAPSAPLDHGRRVSQGGTGTLLARSFTEHIHAELGAWPGGDAVVAYPLLKRMTLNVGSEVFLGEPPSPQAARVNHALIDMVRAPTGLVRKPLPGTRWRAGAAGRRVMEAYFGNSCHASARRPMATICLHSFAARAASRASRCRMMTSSPASSSS